jgi:hypothetical protein
MTCYELIPHWSALHHVLLQGCRLALKGVQAQQALALVELRTTSHLSTTLPCK